MKCSICKKEIIDNQHHNTAPLKISDCCSECNYSVVVPLRLYLNNKDNKKALLLGADGSIKFVEPKDKKHFELKELQSFLEGYIEVYPINDDNYIYLVNEEGAIRKMSFNHNAYDIFNIHVLGNLLVCPKKVFEDPEEEGDD